MSGKWVIYIGDCEDTVGVETFPTEKLALAAVDAHNAARSPDERVTLHYTVEKLIDDNGLEQHRTNR